MNIPPDCLFTVRFGGGTWHQFVPMQLQKRHPALFAISCHSDELGGIDDPEMRTAVINNAASIPSLTRMLPDAVQKLLDQSGTQLKSVPTTSLSLDAPYGSLHHLWCNIFRATVGRVRTFASSWRTTAGFTSYDAKLSVRAEPIPAHSLLNNVFKDEPCHHQDYASIYINVSELKDRNAEQLLGFLLEAFVNKPALGVTNLMRIRNFMVRPMGLRTSTLGCPVSSLLSPQKNQLFAGRFPTLQQQIDAAQTAAQVLLGADDKHLRFRSSVAVTLIGDQIRFSLGTKVQCKNMFGRCYMAVIHSVHLRYITPTMLAHAVTAVLAAESISIHPKNDPVLGF